MRIKPIHAKALRTSKRLVARPEEPQKIGRTIASIVAIVIVAVITVIIAAHFGERLGGRGTV